jgi:hypothetical protein
VNYEELRIGRCSNAARQQQPAGGGNTFRPFLWDFDMAIVRATAKGPVKRKPTGFAMLDWTKTKQQAFLDHLAATANVTAATAKVKFKEGAAYDYRRKSPEFRTAWQGALCEGYAKLELMMLERAMIALRPIVEGENAPDPARTKADEYSNKLVMALLTAHRASVRGEKSESPAKPVVEIIDPRAEFEARFATMRRAMGVPTNGELAAPAQ